MVRPGQISFVAGHPALDFVNTVDWRADPARRADLLTGFDDLVAWARRAGLMNAAEARAMSAAARRHPRRRDRLLRRARRLREVLAHVFLAVSNGRLPAARDLRLLNAFLRPPLRERHLEIRGTRIVWSRARGSGDTFDALLSPIVLAGADLVTADERTRIRECAGQGCGWLFLDTSRNRRRRWCAMESCGNRAKARRFYQRARAVDR